jgi:polyisoprenoid-binding protein YceI
MIRNFALFLTLGACAVAHAADRYTIDPTHTFPRFELSHFGFSTHHGQFNRTTGRLVLDRAAKSGSIEISVQTASVGTGDPKLEEHLRSADFFDVAKFPLMTFRSQNIRFNGDVPVAAEGELTLLGVTRPLTLAISRVKCGTHPFTKKDHCGAEATATLRRSDYGMKAYVPAVGDEVVLRIQVEASRD